MVGINPKKRETFYRMLRSSRGGNNYTQVIRKLKEINTLEIYSLANEMINKKYPVDFISLFIETFKDMQELPDTFDTKEWPNFCKEHQASRELNDAMERKEKELGEQIKVHTIIKAPTRIKGLTMESIVEETACHHPSSEQVLAQRQLHAPATVFTPGKENTTAKNKHAFQERKCPLTPRQS